MTTALASPVRFEDAPIDFEGSMRALNPAGRDVLGDIKPLPKRETRDNKDLHERLDQHRSLAFRWIMKRQDYWQRCYELYRGWHRVNEPNMRGWTKAVINRIFPIIDHKVSALLSSDPKIGASAFETDYGERVERLEKAIDWHLIQEEFRRQLGMGLLDCGIFGTGAFKTWMNWQYGEDGRIDWDRTGIRTTPVPLRNLLADPVPACIDDMQYIGTRRRVSLARIKQLFPRKIRRVVASEEPGLPANMLRSYDEVEEYDENELKGYRRTKGKHAHPTEYTWEEWYVIDTQTRRASVPMSEAEMLNRPGYRLGQSDGVVYGPNGMPAGAEPQMREARIPLYPFGRQIIRVGDVILLDRPWPVERWPISIMPWYPLPGRWWGMSECEQLEGPQRGYNLLYGLIIDGLRYHLVPPTIYEQGILSNSDLYSNRPGAMVEVSRGGINAIKQLERRGMQPEALPMLDQIERSMRSISATENIVTGQQTRTELAATTSSILNRNASIRLGTQARSLKTLFHDLFCLYGMFMQTFYPPGTRFKNVGPNGVEGEDQMDDLLREVKFRAKGEDATFEPKNPEIIKRDMLQLRQIFGEAVDEDLLRAYDHPNPQRVIAKVQQIKQLKAQALAAQAQQGGGLARVPQRQRQGGQTPRGVIQFPGGGAQGPMKTMRNPITQPAPGVG